MRTKKLFAIALLGVGLLLSLNVNAQEEKGSFFDNTFVSGAIGFNYSIPKIANTDTWGGAGFVLDVQAGKWWNSYLGTSVGWHFTVGEVSVPLGVLKGSVFGINYFNVRGLWNISNTIGGVKERFWTVVPYAHLGVLVQSNDGGMFGFGGGVNNQVLLTERLNLLLDLQALIYYRKGHDVYDVHETCCTLMYPNISVGVQYKF